MEEAVFVFRSDRPTPPRAEIGGKAAALAELSRLATEPGAGFRVPRWVAIGAEAFEAAQRASMGAGRLAVPPALCSALRQALHETRIENSRLAVRSSAAAEDSGAASFAGQFDSVLGVAAGDERALRDAVQRVWASAFSARATVYREHRAEDAGPAVRMAVVVQEMVDPVAAGVAFSADPVTGERGVAVVSAVPGLGEGLVSGALDADTFRVALAGSPRIVDRRIVPKEQAIRMTAAGTAAEPIGDAGRNEPAVTDDEAVAVAVCAKRLEARLGAPQDVEWALTRSAGRRELVVLQTRPITTLSTAVRTPSRADGERGERRIWDNSNIVESYSGVTTPLTFTFARAVYEDVYRQFCRLMGVPEALVLAHGPVFANMLGLVRGRVYYNLLNWYRTLALLPGFSFNRGFMERMMGVRERLEDPPPPQSSGDRLLDLARLLRMVVRMVIEAVTLRRTVPAFHARVEAALAPLAGDDLSGLSPDDLLALYRRLERELLQHWRAPLVNDFFAMIFFGALCRLIEKWLPESPPTLANDLLCGEGGIISTEPARAVMGLARRVAGMPALDNAFSGGDDRALWESLHGEPAFADFAKELDAYIGRFGDRCMNELKLETVTLRDDPAFLLQMIRAYAREGAADPDAAREREIAVRRAAEESARRRLRGAARLIFDRVLANARARVRDRENLRFERTRVFGVVRRIVLAFGRHLAARGRIDAPRDVFWLTVPGLFADVEGTGVTGDLRALVELRRAEFEAWARETPPPDRFTTFGPPAAWTPSGGAAAVTSGALLRGLGCCPGVVRAPARIVDDPRHARDLVGHILVAERTDPGWTLLFPAAKGLLVERGSLLSHSAIVAREMGLPCVVGVAGLLAAVRDGELVEMDGTMGVVHLLEATSS
jgi:phosphohistidine swiveling domain-containing protein